MPRLLLIDTCGEGGGIAIAADETLLAHRELPGRETQERLMTALEEVLAEAALSLQQLDAVAIVTGPGSFTGVRIGLAAAKGLAEATGLPLIALSRLAVLAAQATASTSQAWIDAGRSDVFVRSNGTEQMLPIAAAIEAAANHEVVLMEDRLTLVVPGALKVAPVGVAQALPLALKAFHQRNFADAALLEANYLRVPDAELALRARLAAA